MVRPVKRPPVLLQVVSYVSSRSRVRSSRIVIYVSRNVRCFNDTIDLSTSSLSSSRRRDRSHGIPRDPRCFENPKKKKEEKDERLNVMVRHGAAPCRASRLGYVRDGDDSFRSLPVKNSLATAVTCIRGSRYRLLRRGEGTYAPSDDTAAIYAL